MRNRSASSPCCSPFPSGASSNEPRGVIAFVPARPSTVLFEISEAPAETVETVNTLGQPLYARMIPDRDRDEWVRLEVESNPLLICTRPQVLRPARRT